MKDELREILNTHKELINRYIFRTNDLRGKIGFYKSHNLKEEERITRLEYDAIDMIVYNYNNMIKSIEELLDESK